MLSATLNKALPSSQLTAEKPNNNKYRKNEKKTPLTNNKKQQQTAAAAPLPPPPAAATAATTTTTTTPTPTTTTYCRPVLYFGENGSFLVYLHVRESRSVTNELLPGNQFAEFLLSPVVQSYAYFAQQTFFYAPQETYSLRNSGHGDNNCCVLKHVRQLARIHARFARAIGRLKYC